MTLDRQIRPERSYLNIRLVGWEHKSQPCCPGGDGGETDLWCKASSFK